ncbi:hypothetical protein GW17_00037391 [Ensete ventricosum]|nr:hypothetical protein GW17_00037391 [Ensete ventricosum]
MKLLQDLVPGCSKVTGKAVMLDEIINYVQSLQQQVEFLSMKLAALNPFANMDTEAVISRYVSGSNLHACQTDNFLVASASCVSVLVYHLSVHLTD